MRYLPVTHEDIAAVNALAFDLMKPRLGIIVQMNKAIRAYVSDVTAGAVNQAKINETADPVIHYLKNSFQVVLIRQVIESISIGHGQQNGSSFLQEKFYCIALDPGAVFDLLFNFIPENLGKLVVNYNT
jgi:hypothetical protein